MTNNVTKDNSDQFESRIIDAHVHVWTSDMVKYPLFPGVKPSDLWRPSFTPEQHYEYSLSIGKVRFNLVQMIWYGTDHSYILDLISNDPKTFAGTGIIDLEDPNASQTMLELSKKGCYAFREPANAWEHPTMAKLFSTGGKNNLALSFNMGIEGLPGLDKMCSNFPDTPVILDHLCHVGIKNANYSKHEIGSLLEFSKHKNVMIKIGPFQGLGKRKHPYIDLLPLIKAVVEAYGSHRCMWESDSGGPIWMKNPKIEYPAAIELIRNHADFLSDKDKDQLLFKTAEKFFFNR